MNIRNVAIIAHVDHGKTTLVDQMLKQGGAFHANQQPLDRVMDSGDLERERGITILSKNTSVYWGDCKINIVDTPGHADFGGEVERVLMMINGVVLLVDAAEGPMPQTRFVLRRALELNHRVVVVVNKIDRKDARVLEVVDEILELLIELEATDEQLDSPMLFCSARSGTASFSPDNTGHDLGPLFETIIGYIPEPPSNTNSALQMLVSSVDYSDYVGRIAIGRVERGKVSKNQEIVVCNHIDTNLRKKAKAVNLFVFSGLEREAVETAYAGDIIALSGIEDISIGDTVCSPDEIEPLPFPSISPPTMEMTFQVNDSPLAGKEGRFVTSRNLRDRLFRELLKDVSLKITEGEGSDSFNISGRGEMHLSILIETMRREGYEFQVSPPRVLLKTVESVKCEPIERAVVDVPDRAVGIVIEKMSARRGELVDIQQGASRTRIVFQIPTRGLFGYRSEFLSDTRGEGILASVFDSYAPYKGEISRRGSGSLIAFETGEAVAYGLYSAQERGELLISPGTKVYAGMIVGVSSKNEDITVNVCKRKQLTNMRASGSDEALRLTSPGMMSLERCLEFLADDELLEVTPQSLRLRKRILDHSARLRERSNLKRASD